MFSVESIRAIPWHAILQHPVEHFVEPRVVISVFVMKLPHEILGVDRNADVEQIKHAYLELAKQAHPDAGGSKEDFIQLQAAYEALLGFEEAGQDSTDAHNQPWTSYADIVRAAEEERQRSETLPLRSNQRWEFHVLIEFCWSALLTLLAAGVIGTLLSYDGQPTDHAHWSFAFCIALALLIYTCGLAAVVGNTQITNSLTTYWRLMAIFLFLGTLPLTNLQPPSRPVRGIPLISRESVPDWWPVPSNRQDGLP